MFLDEPHPQFEVKLDALVEVTPRTPPPPETTPAWREVASSAFAGGADGYEAAEFLFDGPMVSSSPDVTAYIAGSFQGNEPILAALIDLNARMRKDFTFKAGATTVNTPVRTVLAQRAGVCQDFAHLVIAGLRGIGLPARYVSGYVRTRPAPGQPRRRGADQSHAWVACWMGAELGWIGIDPTNNLIVNDEHVVLGWGRDFSDVSPLRGVILGGGSHRVEVGVDLEPADPADVAEAEAKAQDAR
jgi:transglutaminase-like putative cysteine protease